MEKNQELEQLQMQMRNLLKNIKAKEENIAQLETIPLIAKYNAFLYDREKLQEEYGQKKEEYEIAFQENCPHPLWYFLEELTDVCDRNFAERHIRRICIRCGYNPIYGERFKINDWLKELKVNMIYNVDKMEAISEKISYEKIREEFLVLEEAGYSLEEIRNILYAKYTNQDIDFARQLKMAYVPKSERSK